MSEQTINLNNKEIATYAKTLRQLITENALCEIERKLRKIMTMCANGQIEHSAPEKTLASIRSAFMDSYFNGASDEEMKVFSKINAGRFFSDSAYRILTSIIAAEPAECASMLKQYASDRSSFLQQVEKSLYKLTTKGLINRS